MNIPQVNLIVARKALRSEQALDTCPWGVYLLPETRLHHPFQIKSPPHWAGQDVWASDSPACPVRNLRVPRCPAPALPGTMFTTQLLAAWNPGHSAPFQSPAGLWGRRVSPDPSLTLPVPHAGLDSLQSPYLTASRTFPPDENSGAGARLPTGWSHWQTPNPARRRGLEVWERVCGELRSSGWFHYLKMTTNRSRPVVIPHSLIVARKTLKSEQALATRPGRTLLVGSRGLEYQMNFFSVTGTWLPAHTVAHRGKYTIFHQF